jgi:hypothetical protein
MSTHVLRVDAREKDRANPPLLRERKRRARTLILGALSVVLPGKSARHQIPLPLFLLHCSRPQLAGYSVPVPPGVIYR